MTHRVASTPWLVAALAISCTGCINFEYSRDRSGQPADEAALATVRPGESDLSACLEALGAPDLVWPSDTGDVNLAYAWTDAHEWGVSVSWSFERFLSLRTSFDSVDFEAESIVLAFDDGLRLTHVSRGFLYDIAPSAQASSAAGRMVGNTPR